MRWRRSGTTFPREIAIRAPLSLISRTRQLAALPRSGCTAMPAKSTFLRVAADRLSANGGESGLLVPVHLYSPSQSPPPTIPGLYAPLDNEKYPEFQSTSSLNIRRTRLTRTVFIAALGQGFCLFFRELQQICRQPLVYRAHGSGGRAISQILHLRRLFLIITRSKPIVRHDNSPAMPVRQLGPGAGDSFIEYAGNFKTLALRLTNHSWVRTRGAEAF